MKETEAMNQALSIAEQLRRDEVVYCQEDEHQECEEPEKTESAQSGPSEKRMMKCVEMQESEKLVEAGEQAREDVTNNEEEA